MRRTRSRQARVDHADAGAPRSLPAAGPAEPGGLAQTLAAIARTAARLCEARDAQIFVREGDALVLAEKHGRVPTTRKAGQPFPLGRDTVFGRAVLDRRPIHVRDMAAATRRTFPEVRQRQLATGVRTMLATPLLRDGQATGAIVIRRVRVQPFTARQVALLATFAEQAAIAIDHARISAELAARNAELEARNRELGEALGRQTATAEILRVISSSPTDVQPVLEAVARSAARLCEAADAQVYRLVDGWLTRVASHGPISFGLARGRPGRAWVTGRAVVDRRTVRVRDLAAEVETEFPEVKAAQAEDGSRAAVATPLLREGTPVGAILIRRTEVRPFTDAQIALLETFAAQAVIAIENVRLFTELGERNRELTAALEQQTATAEILRAISSSPTDLRPVMDTVAENACRVCGAEDAIILRIEGNAVRRVAHFGSLPTRMPELSPIGRDTPYGRAILDQRTLHIEDLQPLLETEYRGVRQLASAVGAGTRLVAPLMREGVPIGAILIRRTAVQPFTDKQIALLESFADQAVIAIENVRLFKELETRNRELSEALEQQTATAAILRVISSSPTDIQPVLDVVARSAARLCEARDAAIHLREGDALRRVATVGPLPLAFAPGALNPISRGWVPGRAVLDREPVQVADLTAAGDEFPEGRALALRSGHRTALAVPLLREGEAIGAILIRRADVRPFTDAHVALLQTFAAQAVIAIENVRLFTDLRARTGELTRSVQQLTALGEVGQAVGSTLDLETVLATIASRAAQLAEAEACTVSEYDEETEVFTQRTTHNLPAEIAAWSRARPIRKGEGAIGRLPLTHEPEQIADIAEPGAYQGPLRDPLLRAGLRALLALPLLRETHLVGALAVLRRTPGEFPPEAVGLLRAFATQSAIAIQNARLFLEIEAKGRQLEVASQHKSQFLANMSHELRTPLNAILGYTELIGDGIYGEVPERMREVLERVDASGRHLLGLINDILDLSKIEAGQLRLVLGDYAMADVVQSVAVSAEPLAAAKSLELAVSMTPDLPAGWGDGRRLTQVLLNLVGNAIKFTDAGRVAVRAEAADGAFVVSVTDTGPGIAPAEQERIFEEFQQAETTIRRAKGGTGLGLAISRRIVEMHGGRLWVESALGQGSTFTFRVPVRAPERALAAAEAAG